LKKEGNSLVYTTKDGEVIKQFRKAWEKNEKDGLTTMMAEWDDSTPTTPITTEAEEE
jgi:hypothetical protein